MDKTIKKILIHLTMNQRPIDMLALFARKREIGFVLFLNGVMYRYGVKTIRGKRGQVFAKCVEKALFPLLETLGDGVIVIERRERIGKGSSYKPTIPNILKRFVKDVYPLREISLSEVKQSICDYKKATHQELIETIVQRYPTFLSKIKGVTPEKAKYWEKVLMALALAEVVKS